MARQASLKGIDRRSTNPRILVVDDDERNLLALTQVLQDTAEVVTASSGKDALRLLLTEDVAVILLDVFMPGMDGYEVASLIRERGQTSRIPIIFLSAVNKETEHMMRGYAMGAVDYVFKPVDPIILRSKVSVFVDLYRMRREVETRGLAEQKLQDENFRTQLEKLEIQRELDESRTMQAAIINSLPIVLYLEPDHCFPRVPRFVGGNFEIVTGYPVEALQDNPDLWAERLHPDDRDRALSALKERTRTGVMGIEYRWQCANGEFKYFLDQAAVLPSPKGAPAEFAGTLIDVSDRKQLEAQLLQAGKIDALGQLTGGIAHDFNNLLAAVLGGITLLEKRIEFADRDQTVLRHMRHAADNGVALVKRMMAFARKQDLHPISIAPRTLHHSVLGLLEHTLGGTISLDWQVEEATRSFFADQAQLELALVNLIINARDAMPDGGRIAITCKDLSGQAIRDLGLGGGNFLSVVVEDEGEGIPKHVLDRVVEPFFTTKALGKGTGLGLSMVSGFAQQSGGRLVIDSEIGKGTKMQLVLPACTEAPCDVSAKLPRETPSSASSSILLVDDDLAVREILGGQLQEHGYQVISAESGSEGLQILEAGNCTVDILLTDFAMPGMNGLETIEKAKALQPRLRAILMTGYADDQLLKANEAVPVLRKPIAFGDLERVLAGSGVDAAE
jgi:CheY-like chemotaxis protein